MQNTDRVGGNSKTEVIRCSIQFMWFHRNQDGVHTVWSWHAWSCVCQYSSV